MNNQTRIVITGAAGFVGSSMTGFLNDKGFANLILVDNFDSEEKKANWENKKFSVKVDRDIFFDWLSDNGSDIELIIHLGARTDTLEQDYEVHKKLNLDYSKKVWEFSAKQQIPLIYASSAATYGAGELGYNDSHEIINHLIPLNPYGASKNDFDKWALLQSQTPPSWTGLKFFNVYGPNEYHKKKMASVIWHSFNQIKVKASVNLFKSYNPNYADGQQMRDFIYVKDLLEVQFWLMTRMLTSEWQGANNGIYNLGTGLARSFYDLASCTFNAMGVVPIINYIDMPANLRPNYQYYTEANMKKLYEVGYRNSFYSLERGVTDYVREYLLRKRYL